MRLTRLAITSADSCGGLLDGLELRLRDRGLGESKFEPLCLIGPNGSGKSQFLQLLAEMFQAAFHAVVAREERSEGNRNLLFELEYTIQTPGDAEPMLVNISRSALGKRQLSIRTKNKEGGWEDRDLHDPYTASLLPTRVVGYTSGENETLSHPFLLSRSGYADEVAEQALRAADSGVTVPDTRLLLIDYGTHLEVLVANLLLATLQQKAALLGDAGLNCLYSFRCVVQLAHAAAPRAPARLSPSTGRKGVQLTRELEEYLDQLRRCSTCYDYDERTECYTFDFLVNKETEVAFSSFWDGALALYSAFHKLAMLNDLAIPKKTRDRFKRDTDARRFATRLPEPQDEDKVFRFEQVRFIERTSGAPVDYVSLSDGEHQRAQLLGTFCMVSYPNVLFLLDEPESHFNPQWRVKFISRLLDLPTANGLRRDNGDAARQDCLLTTHAPFVPSDMPRERVFIFSKETQTGKVQVRHPDVETYGTTFDTVLEQCFGIQPPISAKSLGEIRSLMASSDPKEISDAMERLGDSVEKAFLADRVRELKKKDEK